MHLKAIKLRGFKSFVDPVEIHLEPGVAVVVGPNGSGKSNVSDSILWATGSMSPGELRAEKPDDILFAGSVGRQVTYTVLEVEGPPHDRRFTCAATIDGNRLGVGSGRSKKAAEQEAAKEALAKVDPEAAGRSADAAAS